MKLHPNDNALVALTDLPKGEVIEFEGEIFILQDAIKAKHKFFTQDLDAGDEVTMYGVLVGKAQHAIARGSLMTTENLKHAAEPYHYRDFAYQWKAPDVSKYINRTFNGFKRSDGRVGTANYWLFVPTVFCENRNLDVIREALHNVMGYAVSDKYIRFTQQLLQAYETGEAISAVPVNLDPSSVKNRPFKNVDGIKFLNHQGGCGGTRQDASTLSNLLAAYANHPNVGGITVLSLGCQHLQVQHFIDDIQRLNPSFDKPLYVFEQQQSESEEQLVAKAIRQTFEGLIEINKQEREPAPLSELCIGVKCGGSDGFSGVSANPAVGYTSDLLVALGAKVLLAEFPELCGVEQNLVDRCIDKEKAKKFIGLMQEYDALAHKVGSGFHMNPSPGNIKDGLITDAIKSAGAAKKGGTAPVVDVLDYTEPATKPGLKFGLYPG